MSQATTTVERSPGSETNLLGERLDVRPRLDSVDFVRGVVMVIMALDHVRDFFTHLRFAAENQELTYAALFFTRWITHLCAPAFFFLAGAGVYFAAKRRTGNQLTKFLVTRGLFLIALEWTLVWWGWTFLLTFPMPVPSLLVIWALGLCMVVNGLILRLPMKWIAAVSLIMIFGHNLLDTIPQPANPWAAFGWGLLHRPGFYPLPGFPPQFAGLFILYVLIPSAGVMSAGYVFGSLWEKPAEQRRKWLWRLGAGSLVLFALLRVTNLYGNPVPPNTFASPGAFSVQPTIEKTIILFLNTEKYPPSLQFLLMTLGVAFLAIAWLDRYDFSAARGLRAKLGRFFMIIGQVPMFYYLLHIYLAHMMAIFAAMAFGQPYQWLITGGFFTGPAPNGFGFNLPFIYLMWALCVVILYLPCRWYARYKSTHKHWWLSYL
jgi:uncharacterized membrane protein